MSNFKEKDVPGSNAVCSHTTAEDKRTSTGIIEILRTGDGNLLKADESKINVIQNQEVEPQYTEFTKDKYSNTVAKQHDRRTKRILSVIGAEAASLLSLYGFMETHPAANLLNAGMISIPWLLPIPALLLTAIGAAKHNKNKEKSALSENLYDNSEKKVVFTVTSQGNNIHTIKNSIDSVYYWYNNLKDSNTINYGCIINAVIEPQAYIKNKEFYDNFSKIYTKTEFILTVVPESYETSNKTKYKARALNYSVEERKRAGLTNKNVWVYHQDEETTVGEDTLLGISEFINKAHKRTKYGSGFIIYCLDWTLRPSQIQEMTRTSDDYRVLLSLSTKKNLLTGFHGSHFLVRSTVEDEIGWNFTGKAIAEDLIFENILRDRYPDPFLFLKGFAYEKAAYNVKEQIKQRRRWMLGLVDALQNNKISKPKEAVMLYNGTAWFGGIASVASLMVPFVPFTGNFYPISLCFAGYVWSQMITGYYDGYLFHKEYIPKDQLPNKFKHIKIIANGIVGALTDVVAPWYIFRKSKNKSGEFEVLDKDLSIMLRKENKLN